MKVLQLGMTANHGGVESFVLNYTRVLKEHGVAFDYVDLQGYGLVDAERLLSEGSQIFTMKDYRKHPLLTLKRLKQIVRDGDYDCVHVNMLSVASLVPVLGTLHPNTRVLVHSHNSQALGLPRKVLHAVNSTILRMLPVTRLACGKMAGDWMFGKKPYEIVPNAVDVEIYRFRGENRNALRSRLDIGPDTLVLGFAGRLSPQKNPTYLAKILAAVKKKGLENVKLLIVGDGELQEAVREAAAELGVGEDILFVGSQSNVNQWYSAMDALLLPSLWEGLPLVGVEAQTAGLPCFFSDQITREIAMTDLVRFLELTDAADNWARAILEINKSGAERTLYADMMGQTNYSIHCSAHRLYEIYGSAGGTQ